MRMGDQISDLRRKTHALWCMLMGIPVHSAGFDAGTAASDYVKVPPRPPVPRGPPKPPPVFRSLAADGKAAPKRRLSKFGTPDVEQPAMPKVAPSQSVATPAPLPICGFRATFASLSRMKDGHCGMSIALGIRCKGSTFVLWNSPCILRAR